MMRSFDDMTAPFFRAYAAVLFCDSPRIGAWFALVTLWSPRAALAGVVCLLAAALWARLLSLSVPGEPHLVNGLLSGLFIGAFHSFDWTLLGWVVMVALFVTLISHWLARWLWRSGKLPLLSLPFVLACWLIALASQVENAAAMLPAPLSGAADVVFGAWADEFFSALGWLLLTPYPLAGAMLFLGLLAASRYLALLALGGFVAGQLALLMFGRTEANVVGYNFMLSAMALGGIFAVPSRASFFMALAGGVTAGWFTVALGVALYPFHLPLLTLPFLLAVYLWLGGLGSRFEAHEPQLTLDAPQAPELAYERVRLAQVRGSVAGSLPVCLPVYGAWRISQAFDGPHTHRTPWQHALDFDIVEEQNGLLFNHCHSGFDQQDYFCFGAPVASPVAGQVVQLRDDLPDMYPGEADTTNNWGNHILLRTALGDHVLLAHLKQASLLVRQGEWVSAGQPVAACGSSGRAPQPHLHLHVQHEGKLGSPTRPFHLVNVLLHGADRQREFRLYHMPAQNEIVSAAPRDESLAAAMHLLTGQVLSYRLRCDENAAWSMHELRSELTLLGQARLVAGNGASVAFEETPMVCACYDRQGKAERFLDMWVLALGLTPLSIAADHWQDFPALRLLPLHAWQRLLVALLRPLGAGCVSSYTRTWDESAYAWRQEGRHCFQFLPGITWRADTTAWIAPNKGVLRLNMRFGKYFWQAETHLNLSRSR
jgi:urea transporter